MKKSFILHVDSLEILNQISDEQAGRLFKAITDIQTGKEPDLDPITKILLFPFVQQFKRDEESYNRIVERNKSNGAKGGRPKKEENPSEPKNTQKNPEKPSGIFGVEKKPKKADSDSDSDSDSDIKIKTITQFQIHKATLIQKAKAAYPDKDASLAYTDMLEYCKIHGKTYKDWTLAYLRWVREDTYKKYQKAVESEPKRPLKYANQESINLPNFKDKNVV